MLLIASMFSFTSSYIFFLKRYFLLPLNPFPPCQYLPRRLEVEVVSGLLTREGAGLCGALE